MRFLQLGHEAALTAHADFLADVRLEVDTRRGRDKRDDLVGAVDQGIARGVGALRNDGCQLAHAVEAVGIVRGKHGRPVAGQGAGGGATGIAQQVLAVLYIFEAGDAIQDEANAAALNGGIGTGQ